MPAFVRTQADESRWSEAKKAVERSKGKKESDFQDRDWGLTNYLYHKMGKSEDDMKKAEELRKALIASPAKPKTTMPSTSIPNPAKVGQTGVRSPKQKSMPGADAKPSVFFKSEGATHPNIEKLRGFIASTRAKRQSS